MPSFYVHTRNLNSVHHLRPEVKNLPTRVKPFFVQSVVLEWLSHMAEHTDGTARASSVQFLSGGSKWPCHPSLKALSIYRRTKSMPCRGTENIQKSSCLIQYWGWDKRQIFAHSDGAHQFHPGYPQLSLSRLAVSFQEKVLWLLF